MEEKGTGKFWSKQKYLCLILIVIDVLYALFIVHEVEILTGNIYFKAFYLPGLIFSLLIFPMALFFLWRIREKITWIDYTFLAIPLLLWLLIIPGGSFTNFLFINFPLTWTVSLLYLFRFSSISGNKCLFVLFLWPLITAILFAVNHFIPILPE